MTYNPRQPRDKDGRWTDAGGGGPADAATVIDGGPYPKGYAYHATNLGALRGIAKSGKLIARLPREGAWPDDSTGKRIYFNPAPAMNAGVYGRYTPTGGRQVLLRAPLDAAPMKRENLSGFLVSGKSIPADKLEYLSNDGSWRPVASGHHSTGHIVRGMTPRDSVGVGGGASGHPRRRH